MNIQLSKNYSFSPKEVEKKALESERFTTVYNTHRLQKTHKLNQRQDRYDKKKYDRKRKKLRENLSIGERVYVLAERIEKKSAPGKFYKQSVLNISYFNKDIVFTIRKKQVADTIRYYWVKRPLAKLPNRFSRLELVALRSNFL